MNWIVFGVIALVLISVWLVWKRVKRRRRVREVRRVIETLFTSMSARKRLLKALWHFHDTWRPSLFIQSKSARIFAEELKKTLKRFEVTPDNQNQDLGDLVEISIPDGLFSSEVSNTRLRRELRIVIDAVKQTLVLKFPDAPETERHYREERRGR